MANVRVKNLRVLGDVSLNGTLVAEGTVSSTCSCATSALPDNPLVANVEKTLDWAPPALTGTSITWDAGTPSEFVVVRAGHYILHANVTFSYSGGDPEQTIRIKADGATLASMDTFQSTLTNSAKRLNVATGAHLSPGQVVTTTALSTVNQTATGAAGVSRFFMQRVA